ncbi:AraC family transcriptional regulator [Paenibacillus sp. Z6-24]
MADMIFYRHPDLPFLEAKQCLADDLAYHRHFHEEYSIGLIEQGRTNAWCDGTSMMVEQGRVISFPPQMLHACHPEEGMNWQYRMLFIQPEWLQGLERREREAIHIPYLLSAGKNEACRWQIRLIMQQLRQQESALAVESALIEMMQTLAGQESGDVRHGHSSDGDHKYIGRIRDYLHTHFNEKITLAQLEQEVGISRFHLIRLFKQWNHLPPHRYQNVLRVNYAKTELARQRPIADIAVEAGFYDQSHLTRLFTRMVGVTPGKYSLSV